MRVNIAEDLDCHIDDINVKATTTEKLGFVGRKEGIACEAVVLLMKESLSEWAIYSPNFIGDMENHKHVIYVVGEWFLEFRNPLKPVD